MPGPPPAGERTLLAQVAGRPREQPAVELEGARPLGYGELAGLAQGVARGLAAAGLEPGDRVLIVLPNGVEHLVALLAVTSLAAIAVPLDPRTGPARLAYVARATAPRLCLAAEGFEAAGVATLGLRVDPDGPQARLGGAALPAGRRRGDPAPIGPDTPALIRFTSGSTGRPKGVVLTHGQQRWTATTLSRHFGLAGGHRELIVASMAYSGGWQRVAATLAGGGCLLLPRDAAPLSVTALLEDLEARGATGFFSPPPLVRTLLASPEPRVRRALAGCRGIEIGSAAIAPGELRRLLELAPGARVFVHYGLTECSRALILDARAHPGKLHTVGRPAPGVEVSICDAAGRAQPAGRPGQILLRGPQQARAYWEGPGREDPGREGSQREGPGREGPGRERPLEDWLATGDQGVLDDDGFLTFLGREDDVINSGGHSFHPAEVERELGPVDGIAQILVLGVPDPKGLLGELPVALVVAAGEQAEAPRRLLAAARRRLPPHMVPRRVQVVPELPLTGSGKPDRRRAAALFGASGEG